MKNESIENWNAGLMEEAAFSWHIYLAHLQPTEKELNHKLLDEVKQGRDFFGETNLLAILLPRTCFRRYTQASNRLARRPCLKYGALLYKIELLPVNRRWQRTFDLLVSMQIVEEQMVWENKEFWWKERDLCLGSAKFICRTVDQRLWLGLFSFKRMV